MKEKWFSKRRLTARLDAEYLVSVGENTASRDINFEYNGLYKYLSIIQVLHIYSHRYMHNRNQNKWHS